MSTVNQITDRVYRDWLYPPEDQPVTLTLAANVTDSTTTWTYDDSTLAPDEEDLLAPGVLIEAGTELARITAVNDSSNSLTVTRGVNGTTAQAHNDDDVLHLAPTVSRHTVVEAVKDSVVGLYPQLWQVATEQVTTSDTYIEVPATTVTPVSFLWLDADGRYKPGTADLLDNFPPSTTGKAIQVYGIPTGKTAYFTYRGKFARPTAVGDELADLGVDAHWERIVTVGAAAQVVGQRPLDELTAEYIVEQLQRDALPPGASTDIRNGLLTLWNIWADEARRALIAAQPTPVLYNVVSRG